MASFEVGTYVRMKKEKAPPNLVGLIGIVIANLTDHLDTHVVRFTIGNGSSTFYAAGDDLVLAKENPVGFVVEWSEVVRDAVMDIHPYGTEMQFSFEAGERVRFILQRV